MTATASGVDRPPLNPDVLRASRQFCMETTKAKAANFYYGLKLLPDAKRAGMYALYAYMRLIDDIADDESPGHTPARRKAELDAWERVTQQAIAAAHDMAEVPAGHAMWPAFTEMVRTYKVPEKVFSEMIAGQRQDLEPVPIPTFEELHQYCYRVASVVGVASLYVFGFSGGEETLALGADRGIAFQLTNILRDLREDAARGRCYLPTDELAKFGVTQEQMQARDAGGGYMGMMRQQIDRARDYYTRSAALESRLEADARPTLAAMTAIYRGILEKIAQNPAAVLNKRVGLSAFAKLRIGWRAMRGNF